MNKILLLTALCLIILLNGCQGCSRDQISHSEPMHQHEGIPNTNNVSCYINSCLQIIARLYPDLFSNMGNELGRYGQEIVNKITSKDPQTYVTADDARNFSDALLNSYNKHHTEQLHHGDQEDAAPVLNFLLQQGKVQEIRFHANSETDETKFSTGPCIVVNLESQGTSMDTLVASSTERVQLDIDNIRGLTNRILPIWVHRFSQTSNQDPDSGAKITTPITNPFTLTIAPEYFIENTAKPYTSSLAGFIYQSGNLNGGHYIAYVRNQAGKWIRYNDETVTELHAAPLEDAQKAYLYFYQAD